MKRNIRASDIRTVSFFAAVLFALPGLWKGFQGLHVWLSPFLMLNSVFALKSFVFLNLLALPVLVMIILRKRWFCNYLCPAGWCFDKVQKTGRSDKFDYSKVPAIGKWLAITSLTAALFGLPLFVILDPLSIFNGFFVIFSGKPGIAVIISFAFFPLLLLINLVFPGIWCRKLCPLGGLQTGLWDIRLFLSRYFTRSKPGDLPELSGRRYFIMSGVGLVAGLSLRRTIRPSETKTIHPPGATEPALYNVLCSRCGNCIKACPTKILLPDSDFSNPLSWMTPAVSFKSGYCLETCNLCGKVCPTGAITLFSTEAKRSLFMGTAHIRTADCYLSNNRECIKCREACKYNAVAFLQESNIFNMLPAIDPQKCVGCGACEVVCPAGCINISAPY